MNVASLENCKELYELTKWNYTNFWWFHGEKEPMIMLAEMLVKDDGVIQRRICSAYDLGYLLRKLPRIIHTGTTHERFLSIEPQVANRSQWSCKYSDEKYTKDEFMQQADSPEDAACLLLIELIKQGLVK